MFFTTTMQAVGVANRNALTTITQLVVHCESNKTFMTMQRPNMLQYVNNDLFTSVKLITYG